MQENKLRSYTYECISIDETREIAQKIIDSSLIK